MKYSLPRQQKRDPREDGRKQDSVQSRGPKEKKFQAWKADLQSQMLVKEEVKED